MMQINLDFLRSVNVLLAHFPGTIDSVCRTVNHNAFIGGAPGSAHLCDNGECAVDLMFDDRMTLIAAARFAFGKKLCNGIELDLRNEHLHLDNKVRVWQVVYLKDGSPPRTLESWVQQIPSEV